MNINNTYSTDAEPRTKPVHIAVKVLNDGRGVRVTANGHSVLQFVADGTVYRYYDIQPECGLKVEDGMVVVRPKPPDDPQLAELLAAAKALVECHSNARCDRLVAAIRAMEWTT